MCPLETKYVLETFTFSLFDGHHLYFRAKSDHQCLLMESTSCHHSISPGELEGWSWISSIGITWELVSNQDSQVPPKTYWFSICILIGLPLVRSTALTGQKEHGNHSEAPRLSFRPHDLTGVLRVSKTPCFFLGFLNYKLEVILLILFIHTPIKEGYFGEPPKNAGC